MSCTIDSKVLRNVLQTALRTNPEKYRNLENSILDILKVTNLTDEAKIKIIAAYNEVYKHLASKSSVFNLNKLDTFIDAKINPLINDSTLDAERFTQALSLLRDKLSIDAPKETTQNLRSKELAIQLAEAIESPLVGRYGRIRETLDTILRERSLLDAGIMDEAELNSAKIIENALAKLETANLDKRRLGEYRRMFYDTLAELRTPQNEKSYVDLRTIAEFGSDRYEAYLEDGSVVDLIKKDNEYFYADENLQITDNLYDTSTLPAPKRVTPQSNRRLSNDASTVILDADELRTGLVLIGANQEQFEQEIAASSASPLNSLTITADTSRAERNSRRLEVIKANSAKYPGLENRTMETMESPAQIKRLQQGKPVLTKARMTDGFSVLLTSPSGQSMTLMDFNNYVVVYPDNTTRLLDLENEEDLELFAALTNVRGYFNSQELSTRPTTLGDLQIIRDGARRAKEFRKEVQALLDKGETVIPTELFAKYYEFNNVVYNVDFSESIDHRNRIKDTRLDDFMSKHNAGVTVSVINESDLGNVSERRLPLLFAPISRRVGAAWSPVELLGPGEFVVVDGKRYKWREYVNTFHAPKGGKVLNSLSKLKAAHHFAMVIPSAGGINAIAPLVRMKSPTDSATKAKGMLSLFGYIDGFTPGSSTSAYTKAFNNKVFGFDVVRYIQPDFFTNKTKSGESFLGVQFTATGSHPDEEFFNDNKDLVRFAIDKKPIDAAVQAVKEFFQAEGLDIDMDSQEGIEDMTNQLDALFSNPNPTESVQNLKETLDNLYDKFTKKVYKQFDAKIDALLNHEDVNTRTAAERMMENKENFLQLMFDTRNKGQEMMMNDRAAAQNDLSTYYTIKANYKTRLSMQYNLVHPLEVLNNETAIDIGTPVIVNDMDTSAALGANTTVKPGESQASDVGDFDDDMDDFDPFGGAASLGNALERAVFEAGEFQRQVNYIRERLPEGIAIDDLNKIVRHLDADGNVLGYIKDKVIYLNEQLSRPGTPYHEAFHAVFRYLMTPQERADLLAREYERMGTVSEAQIAEFRRQRRFTGHLSNTQVLELMAEERLADKFQSYATKKTKPATWYSKLFNLIEKLIEFFTKHKDDIENTFDRIHSGFYKNATVKEFSGVEGAYQLIKTVPTFGLVNGKPTRFYESMNAQDMMNLRNLMVAEMLTSKAAGLTTSQLYDEIAKQMVTYYNIDNLIAQSPQLEKEIREKYETSFRDMRYVLGGMNLGEKFSILNITGDPNYDNKFISADSKDVYVQNAKESYRQMKQMVLEVYNNLNIVSTVEDAAATDQVQEGENNAETVVQAKNEVEESGSKDPDISLLETGTSEGDREFRKIFQFLTYEHNDPRLGIKMKKAVNADKLFDTVKKITVNTPKDQILDKIQQVIDRLDQDISDIFRLIDRTGIFPVEYDNVYEMSKSLKAMMEMLNKTCGIEKGVPTRSEAMFNQFHSVFYVATGEITQVNIRTTRSRSEGENAELLYDSTLSSHDMVQSQDNWNAFNKIVENYNTNYLTLSAKTKETIQNELAEVRNNILDGKTKNISEFYLENGKFSDAKVSEAADDLYVVSAKAGLGIPRHFFHFSLGAMIIDSGYKMPRNSETFALVKANREIYAQKGYMDSYMLTALRQMLEYNNPSLPLFENDTASKSIKSNFLPAMTYLTRYDSTIGQPVVRNTTGNKIYRFTLYSPNMQIVQDVQNKGLETFVNEVYGREFMDYFKDNPYLSEEEMGQLFMDYLNVGYLGGISQRIDGRTPIGTDISSIDKPGYHLANFALFNDRKTFFRGTNQLTTFKRITSQNDSTGTVFHVTGRYEKYVNNSVDMRVARGNKKVTMVSSRLADLVQQEYNRIAREWQERSLTKQRYVGYNAVVNKENKLVTDDPTLRAYNFQQLDSFFLNELDPSDPKTQDKNVAERIAIRQALINAAKSGKTFEEAIALPELTNLYSQLDAYANDEFEFFVDTLVDINVLNKDKDGNLTSDYFNNEIRVDGRTSTSEFKNVSQNLKDYFYNDWVNRLMVNQLFDGDRAVGVKSAVDYYKRLKSQAAAGPNAESASSLKKFGNTTYRHAIFSVASEKGAKEVKVYFDADDLTKPQSHSKEGMSNPVEFDIMDGHVHQRLTHRMKFLLAEGKLDAKSESIIRSLRHKRLSFEEIKYLESRGIQLNPQKTVTAHPIHYLKMSEHYINRFDVSYYKGATVAERRAARKRVEELYKLADLYEGQLELGVEVNEEGESIENLYRDTVKSIHSEFAPNPGREMLHNLLNNMEYHRLGQALDSSASKRGSIVPTVLTLEDLENPDAGYWDMESSIATVPMRYTYNQVVTEAHHHDVTDSIQPKLLIDTDLDLNDPNVPEDLKTMVREYRRLLADMSATSREKFKRMITKNREVDVASFFKIVQESLQKQGAPQHMLKKWDVIDGQPVHSTNLSGIADALKYYVFSMANTVMFQPKAPGYKFYHGSSFGYKVIVDENDNVIPDEEIRKDPGKYAGYQTRYPSFRKTTNEAGVDDYYVEVLIPRPISINTKKLRIIEQSLEEFFGTRIPTEDKRSMVRVKVVGYIDASFINTIVVPEQVHHLSGSDKDIDALYTRMQGMYENVLGEANIYGDYSEYENRYGMDTKTAKFVEYLHYMMDDPFYGPLVNKEIRRMREDEEYKVENLRESSAVFGPKVQAIFNRAFDEVMKDMKSNFSKLKNEGKIAAQAGKTSQSLEELSEAMQTQGDEQSRELARQCKLLEKLTAVINVLQDSSMPLTPDALETYEAAHGSPVIPKLQNQVTTVMNKILGHQYVYNNLYSKESANADIYKNATEKLGRNEKDTIGQSNYGTITSTANVRDSNKSAKRGIEIFASFNKGLSMAVKHGLTLAEPIWNIDGVTHDSFTHNRIDEAVERAHALIGNSLGMSADAAKSPYPAVLSLNQYNMGVTATMLSLGINPYLAIYINLMPSVKDAIDKYAAEAEGSVRKNMKRNQSLNVFLANRLTRMLNKMAKSSDSYEQSFAKNFDLSDYEFSYDVNNVQPEIVNGDNPTVDSLGLTVTHKKGLALTDAMKDAVVFAMFNKQYEQAEAIRFELTPLTDAQKSLAPDFNNIDRLLGIYNKDRSKSVFNGYNNIFNDSPVYNILSKSVELIDELTQKLFLVRRPMVKELTNILNRAIYEATPEGVSGNINSIFAMEALKNMVDKAMADPELETKSPVMYARYKSFQQMLKADYWYNNDMITVVKSLKRQFPGNAFLDAVVEFKGKNNIRVLRSMSKAKVSTDLETMIMNGLDQLLMNPDAEVRNKAYQVFYYSIVKDGLGKAAYSLRSYLNPDNFREISNELKKVEKAFAELDKFGKTTLQASAYANKFNEVFKDVFGNENTMDKMLDTILSKVVSVYETEARENNVRVINYTGKGKFKEAGATKVRELIEKLRPGMGEEVIAEAYTGKDSKGRKRKFVKPIGTIKEKKETEETKDLRSDNDLFLPDADGRVNLDLTFATNDPDQDELLDDIVTHVKIFPRRITAANPVKEYSFPLYVTNTYGDLMMLESVNDVSINERITKQIFNKVNALAEETELTSGPLIGNKASYKVVNRMGNEHISPIAFSAEEASKLHSFEAGVAKPEIKIETLETGFNDDVVRYKGIEVKYDSDLKRSGTNEPGGAKYFFANNTMVLNRELLMQKYFEKAWTNPLLQRDKTYSTAFPEDFFKSYEEWEQFVMEHERQHGILGTKRLYEEYGAYEDRVNRAAIAELFPGRDASFLESTQGSSKGITPGQSDVQNPVKTIQPLITTPSTPLQIFVDGSDIKGTGKLGYGAAVEHNGTIYKMSGTEETQAFKSFQARFPDAKFSNPTMEMLGLVMTLNNFVNKSEHIVINQDYKGAVNYGGLWMRSEGSAQREPKPWNAKEAYIKYLVGMAEDMIQKIESNGGSVKLNWVKGHAGNRMNDAADEAAKNRGTFNEFTKLFDSSSVDQVIESKEEQSKDCNKGNK